MQVKLTVNGEPRSADVEPRLLLVHYLREHLGLRAANVGCDTTSCGACTVLLDGQSVKSCTVLTAQAQGQHVTTAEGVGTPASLSVVQAAFRQEHGLQCGFCTPGMVMAATSLLAENPRPSETQVREGLEGNFCRCTGYHNIVRAVLAASAAMAEGGLAEGGLAEGGPRDGAVSGSPHSGGGGRGQAADQAGPADRAARQ
jgi:carbon-monoxide dehydrogenase small subunit